MRPIAGGPRTVFIGTGRFGIESLRRIASSAVVSLVGVVTAPPRPAGRGQRVVVSPVEVAARETGDLPILAPRRLRTPDSLRDVLALDPALIVLADYGQIIPPDLLAVPFGALNLHPSLLPRHRGASPIAATILAGDAVGGVTIMRMDAGLDTGPIVALEEVALAGDETAPVLEDRLSVVAADLLVRTLPRWIRHEIETRPQPLDGATLTRPLRRDDGRLDPARPAAFLERQVRAYQPWPGSYIETPAGRCVVWRANVEPSLAADEPGRLAADGRGVYLATVDGRLRFEEAQLPGTRRMSVSDLLRGHRDLVAAARVDSASPGRTGPGTRA